MIQKYIYGLATRMEIPLSQVTVVEGKSLGCLGVVLVHLHSGRNQVSILVYESEYSFLPNEANCHRLNQRICNAFERLKKNIHEE